jgi:hypothetical protein
MMVESIHGRLAVQIGLGKNETLSPKYPEQIGLKMWLK